MTSSTQSRPVCKPSPTARRSVRLLAPLDADGQNAEIEIQMPKGKKTETFRYWLDKVASDFGTAYRFEKQGDDQADNEEYYVLFDGPQISCECLGFLRWAHCKHADCAHELRQQGIL